MTLASVKKGSVGSGAWLTFFVAAGVFAFPAASLLRAQPTPQSVVFNDVAQRGGCLSSLRPVTTAGQNASFVITARVIADAVFPGQPKELGEPGSVFLAASGAGVQSASCEGDTAISGASAYAPEMLRFTFDAPLPLGSIVLGLSSINLNQGDQPVIYLSSITSAGFDKLILANEVNQAFESTGADQGVIEFRWFSSVPSSFLIDSFAIIQMSGDAFVSSAVVAPNPSANLDQVRNGPAGAPVSPGTWVNGNAGSSNAHYVESFSIPYRVTMENLPTDGTVINLTMGYDIKHSSKHAVDYLTHYFRLEPHVSTYGHSAETIDPTIGVSGVSGLPTDTEPIPAPSSAGSGVPGMPTSSFNALPAGERVMSLWNGTFTGITYGTLGDLSAATSETEIIVSFMASSPTAVLAWGGHIGYGVEWSPEGTAGGISGSPYHMRLKDWNLGNLGNQDRSLSADAAVTPCCDTLVCDDNDACTNDFCDPLAMPTCECVFDPAVTCPGDGIFCNGTEVCDPATGNCVSINDPCFGSTPICCEDTDSCAEECCFDADCVDPNFCTTDTCVNGVCQHTPVKCNDDGIFCNGGNLCNPANGQCEFTGNPCSGGTPICCEDTDSCAAECCFDSECNDGLLCTNDACVGGVCVHTQVICTDDGLFCNGAEVCDPATGGCVHTGDPCGGLTPVCCEGADTCEEECCFDSDCNDFDLCTTDTCVAGVCQFTPVSCPDDGLFCNGNEVCDPATGVCVHTGDPCGGLTPVCCEGADTCEEECCFDSDCNDFDLCTTDTCVAGVCQFTPVSCPDDGVFCNGDEVCDPATGGCVHTGDPCSGLTPVCCEAADTCEEECCFDADCDDSDLCTTDTCVSGVCQNAPVICPSDGIFCNGVEECDPATGMCVSPGDPCGAGFICCENTDTCATECCLDADCPDDGAFCTGEDLCVNGSCINTGGPCAPGEVCCEANDTCQDECCNDLDCPTDMLFCTGDEVCVNGVCQSTGDPCGGATPICCEGADTCEEECCVDADCNDFDLCTTDTCNAGVCQFTPVVCMSDGVFCNGVEMCDPATGMCVSPGNPCGGGTPVCCEAADVCEEECCGDIDCEDGDLCTTDTCVNGVCTFPPVVCPPNGNFCDGVEACDPATGNCVSPGSPCSGPTPICCEAADVCEEECCSNPECNDSLNCTTDACVNGQCQYTPKICLSDGQFCNGLEVCNPATGQCHSPGSPCVGQTDVCCEVTDTCVAECCVDGGCNDLDKCTIDRCLGGSCVHVSIAGCCTTHQDCDDGEQCTIDTCVDNACLHTQDPQCPIPTTTHWGMTVLGLLLLIGARVYFGRRQERVVE